MTLLDRAIELDPCDPLAVALLACCHAQLALNLGTSWPPAARAEAEPSLGTWHYWAAATRW
jgi:hypothetical protein